MGAAPLRRPGDRRRPSSLVRRPNASDVPHGASPRGLPRANPLASRPTGCGAEAALSSLIARKRLRRACTHVASTNSEDYLRALDRFAKPRDRIGGATIAIRHSLPVRLVMTRFRRSQLTLAMVISSATALRAQAWPAGSVGFDKAIFAKIYIGVGDALAPPYPIQGVRVLLVSAANDTVRLATDGAGATSAFVPRGQYQLVTLDWVSAGGKDYKWNLPLTVAPGMRDMELTAQNAAPLAQPTIAESPGEVETRRTDAMTALTPGESAPKVLAGRRRVVDSSGFVWDVFEQRFSRGAVWGTALTLPTVELLLVFNRDDETRQLDHFPANWRSLSNEELAAWLAKATRTRP